MSKVSYIDVLPELEDSYYRQLRPGDRFVSSRIARKIVMFSRKRKAGLRAKSLLPQIAELWASLSGSEKEAWTSAGEVCGLNGWRLFVQDTTARIINDLSGSAVPETLHQSWIGNLHIEAPASNIKIVQTHPHFYYISRKITGTKGQFSPVLVNEDLSLPFILGLNYASDLAAVGPNPFARLFARFWYSYQGVNLMQDLVLELDLQSGWKFVEATLTFLETIIVRYDLFFEVNDLRGDLYFDNVKAEHSGQNWARDPFCKDINQGFTRAFYQIPKHWAGVEVPVGSQFESIYKDFS
jgi:hypothetical protein